MDNYSSYKKQKFERKKFKETKSKSDITKSKTKSDNNNLISTPPKPIENDFSVAKILAGAAIAGSLGAGLVFLSQISKNRNAKGHRLSPPAPNMEERDPTMSNQFRSLMDWFYRMCPDENKNEYKRLVKSAISLAELVCIIENQILKHEVHPHTTDRVEANLYALLSMKYLRETRNLFHTKIINDLTDILDVISFCLSTHLQNIRTLTSIN